MLITKVIRFYSGIYKTLAVGGTAFICLGILGCILEATKGRYEVVGSYISSGGLIILITSRFYIWRKICTMLCTILELDSRKVGLRKISRFLSWSFLIDLLCRVYPYDPRWSIEGWNDLSFPTYSGNPYLFTHDLITYFFKITDFTNGFLTPTTFGLATLFLALLTRNLSETEK